MNLEKLRALPPGEALWDETVRGLHVRASGAGVKTFFFYYRTRDGRQRRPKIGELGQMTLGEARRLARSLQERVTLGEDPKGAWQEKKGEKTVEELFEAVWASYWSTPRFQASRWGKEAKRIYQREVEPHFGKDRLSEVTSSRVREWHQRYLETPYQGNRALAVLSRMFNFAEEREWRAQNCNPCNLVKNHPEKKRKRYATEDEIGRIAPLIEKYAGAHPHGVAFLYLLMFSGSRPIAIERAGWDQLREFELDGEPYGILTFYGKSSGKTGQDEQVILPPQAMRAVRRLPRIEGMTITGIKMPRRLWRKIKEEAGCEDLWARDWRRTFATVGMSGGMDVGVIGELLNHHSAATTKIYAKVMDSRKVEAATAIAQKLEGIMNANGSTGSTLPRRPTLVEQGLREDVS